MPEPTDGLEAAIAKARRAVELDREQQRQRMSRLDAELRAARAELDAVKRQPISRVPDAVDGLLRALITAFVPPAPPRTPPETVYFHGGPAGLKRGALILPPAVTGARLQGGDDDLSVKISPNPARMNSVYITTNFVVATDYAVDRGLALGRSGSIYRVQPHGEISVDLETSGVPDIAQAAYCSSATVLEVIPLNWFYVECAHVANALFNKRHPYPEQLRFAVARVLGNYSQFDATRLPDDIRDILNRLHEEGRWWELAKWTPDPDVKLLMDFARDHPALFNCQLPA